jgi:hypothetical protein
MFQFLSSGYASHLEILTSPGGSRPASGNAVFLLSKKCFSLPSSDKRSSKNRFSDIPLTPRQFEVPIMARQDSAASAQTLITISDQGNTLLQPVQPSFGAAAKARGTSPRPKMSLDSHYS